MNKKIIIISLTVIILILGGIIYRTMFTAMDTRESLAPSSLSQESGLDSSEALVDSNQVDVSDYDEILSKYVDEEGEWNGPIAMDSSLASEYLEIVGPVEGSNYYVGDTLEIELRLKLEGLQSFFLVFADMWVTDIPINDNPRYKYSLTGDWIEDQTIAIMAFYNLGDETQIISGSRKIKIIPKEVMESFKITPDYIVIEKDKTGYIYNYTAIFPSGISQFKTSSEIKVRILDSEIASYDNVTGKFTGLKAGFTEASISYRGKEKAAIIEVVEYKAPPTDPTP